MSEAYLIGGLAVALLVTLGYLRIRALDEDRARRDDAAQIRQAARRLSAREE